MTETTLVLIVLWFHVAITGGIAALAWWLPRLTRRDLYFAVTVDPAYREGAEGRRAMALYGRWWWGTVLLPVLAAVGCALSLAPPVALLVVPGLMMVQVVGMMCGFLVARHDVLSASRAPVDSPPPEPVTEVRLPGGLLAQLGPFLVLAAVALLLVVAWDAIPERYPTHYDASFQPDAWSERTIGGVALPLAFAFVFMLPMWWIEWALVRRARQTDAGPGEPRRRRVNAEILLGALYLVALLAGVIAVGPLFQAGAESARAWLTVVIGLSVVGTLALLAWIAVRLLPLYTRRSHEAAPAGEPLGDRTADAHWKWGLFYYNPADPALFIEKRFGIGYTMNMARPAVWLMLAALLVLPLLLILPLVF